MPVDQWLDSVTSRMGVLIYLGRYFQDLHAFSGKPSIVSTVRIQTPPPIRRKGSAMRRGSSYLPLFPLVIHERLPVLAIKYGRTHSFGW